MIKSPSELEQSYIEYKNLNIFEFKKKLDSGYLNVNPVYIELSDHITNNVIDNIILTTYLTSKNDPQKNPNDKNAYVKVDDYNYMKPWYDSMIQLNIYGIIFHDMLSDEFIKKYETDKIKFIKVHIGKYSLNDERFYIYYDFLLRNKYKNVFMTDIRDVYIKHDPSNLMVEYEKYTLFVGSDEENMIIKDSSYMISKIKNFNTKHPTPIPCDLYHMKTYNCGIIGGNYFTVLYLLCHMTNIMTKLDNNLNNNMIVLNYIVFLYFTKNNINVFTGHPLNSRFKKYEFGSSACFIHK